MHAAVNSFLGFEGGCIPERQFVVIGQGKADNGHFLLHQIMSAAVKEHKSVCLVSFAQKFHHYKAVAQKIGVSLQAAVETKQFQFFDGLEELASTFYPAEPCGPQTAPKMADILDGLKEKILQLVSEQTKHRDTVLVMDEVSLLVGLGFSVGDVCMFMKDFAHTVLAMGTAASPPQQHGAGSSSSSSVLALCSYAEEDRDSCSLWQFLVHQSTLDVNVTPLQTGFCKDVHGQATVRWRHGMDVLSQDCGHSRTVQFKLGDNTVHFFAAGTSAAVL